MVFLSDTLGQSYRTEDLEVLEVAIELVSVREIIFRAVLVICPYISVSVELGGPHPTSNGICELEKTMTVSALCL